MCRCVSTSVSTPSLPGCCRSWCCPDRHHWADNPGGSPQTATLGPGSTCMDHNSGLKGRPEGWFRAILKDRTGPTETSGEWRPSEYVETEPVKRDWDFRRRAVTSDRRGSASSRAAIIDLFRLSRYYGATVQGLIRSQIPPTLMTTGKPQ